MICQALRDRFAAVLRRVQAAGWPTIAEDRERCMAAALEYLRGCDEAAEELGATRADVERCASEELAKGEPK